MNAALGGETMPKASILRTTVGAALAALILSACGNGEDRLPGQRLDIRASVTEATDGAVAAAQSGETIQVSAVRLPAPQVLSAWTHRNGTATHRVSHSALARDIRQVWSTSIGQKENRRQRITAAPVAEAGRIFTLDAAATVVATSTDGARLWSRDLTPPREREDDATGGGLAIGGGRLFVTSAFGSLSALDPATGAVLWQQRLDAVVTGAPTVRGDLVYVVSRDNTAWAIDTKTGRVRWQIPGLPNDTAFAEGASPAVDDRIAILPYSSGEVVAVLRRGGVRLWGRSISGRREGPVYAEFDDVSADPVIAGDRVYVGTQAGRVVALATATGQRLWTAETGAYGPVWPVGGAVFLVSDQGLLIRLDAETGEFVWETPLPHFKNRRADRRKAVYAHYGPVLAGGRLIVASSDGQLRSFDPSTGALLDTVPLRDGAASAPIVVGNTLYVVSSGGDLIAFR